MNKLKELYNRDIPELWAHPELVDSHKAVAGADQSTAVDIVYNFNLPEEERRENVSKLNEGLRNALAASGAFDNQEVHKIKGCPEEPDAEVEVLVYHPANQEGRILPGMLVATGGGLYSLLIEGSNPQAVADKYQCVLVCPRYRLAFEAKYPAAINDLHAGYQWMIEHADELGVNPDNTILTGGSSGSHLALSLAFRLKRYGYRPRGCVVQCSLVDNRPIFPSSTMTNSLWDGRAQWLASVEWLGPCNVAAFNGPEMYPNYASAEECIGLCPVFIHADGEDASVDACRVFASKLTQAGVYNELHCWGGSVHGIVSIVAGNDPDSDYGKRYQRVYDGNITDCIKYDLRREWIINKEE